ncbi:hypothetical protein P170DRAFT_513892 [Aspergillus steynii IBT 23096]|uniref:Uncharacterized protein n=1 Tax=Aspergillus steynii IBT 23096 TaxID=1392250 RepID=A0A2I2FSC4_9EURO|nr:uncharacterized protein P170DRAFT_513892 [Aspergillus steynii IBT 23096]PLB43538.1 hypothetical protein P170DRAFT_513892 [Aspergillus steynii IBT 23096]
METKLFDKSWIGKVVSFANSNTRWRLTAKLRDKNNQFTAGEMKDFPDAISGAYGTFKCENVDHPTKTAFMRIAMQVPYAGAKPDSLARQASQKIPSYGQLMLDAYSTFRERDVQSTARLLDMKSESQDHTGMLPGGSILYLVIEKAPGKQLYSARFWSLESQERDKIRYAFAAAWRECVANGFRPFGDVSSLFWDSLSGTITIYNLMTAYPTDPTDEWSNMQWIVWGLAKAPDWYRWWAETDRNPSMEGWLL